MATGSSSADRPHAVVGHQDAGQAAAVGLDLDPGRAGVDGVVDQLLDGAGRPFDHLAGGDAVDGLGRQAADRHRGTFVGPRPALHCSIVI
jgi:hypothetical protein